MGQRERGWDAYLGRGLASRCPAHAKHGFWLQGLGVGRAVSLMSLLAESPTVPSAPAGLSSLLSSPPAHLASSPCQPMGAQEALASSTLLGSGTGSAGGGEGGRKALGTGLWGGARIPSVTTQTPEFLSYLLLRERLSQPVLQVTELWGKGMGRKV